MSEIAQPLGGIHISEAYYPALDRLSVAFNLIPEEQLNAATALVETAVDYQQHNPSETPRVWWHVNRGGHEQWISINPGEYRTTPPQQPCVIREASLTLPRTSHRALLQEVFQTCSSHPPVSPFETSVYNRAVRLMRRQGDGDLAGIRQELRNARRITKRDDYQSLIQRLYQEYFEELVCPVSTYTHSVLLLQLQATSNAWIEQDWTARPIDFLDSYVAQLLHTPQTARRVLEVCELEYDDGRKHLRSALAGTMKEMPRHLMFVWHRFYGAFRLLKLTERAGLSTASLNPIVVEEASACTIAGLNLGAWFFFSHPEEEPLARLRVTKLSPIALSQKTRASSSETEPKFTRKFSEIISAHAMTLCGEQTVIKKGIETLLKLRNETNSFDAQLENAWMEHALLNGYRELGDRSESERYALMIAVRMSMRT